MKPVTVVSLLLTLLLTTGVTAGYESDCYGNPPSITKTSTVNLPEELEMLELSALSVLVY
ncbi:MAG: hypothetical protein JNK20_15950 [Flavipsychrobacter sp.]|jgi:hypothetical protein|nr:hypothetical protein [Flavipsychrobacter sp.]